MDATRWEVPLSEDLRQGLSVKVDGTKGFPGLVGEIQQRITGSRLAMDQSFLERIRYFAFNYGRGPWQTLLRDLLDEIGASKDVHPGTDVREPSWTEGRGRLSLGLRVRRVPLSRELLDRLSLEVADTGGFPGLLREVQARIAGCAVEVDDAFIDRVRHYAFDYGSGPWQLLLRDLLHEVGAAKLPS